MIATIAYTFMRHRVKILIIAVMCMYISMLYRGSATITNQQVMQWGPHIAKTVFSTQKKYLQGTSVEYVTFKSKQNSDDAISVFDRKGILYINPLARANIIVCHGFMCDKFDISFLRKALFEKYNVLVFDFRAHGENIDHNQYCTFGKDEALDVQAAVHYMKSRVDIGSLPCICYGFSMGAVAAILAQQEDSALFNCMILDCPYDESDNVLRHSIQKLYITVMGHVFDMPGRGLLEKFAFNPYVQGLIKVLLKMVAKMDATATNTYIYPASPLQAVESIKVPCFFIHCRNDEKVPVSAAKKLFNGADCVYKRLWITNGRRHYDSIFYNPDKYVYKVQYFIESYLDGLFTEKEKKKIVYDKIVHSRFVFK